MMLAWKFANVTGVALRLLCCASPDPNLLQGRLPVGSSAYWYGRGTC